MGFFPTLILLLAGEVAAQCDSTLSWCGGFSPESAPASASSHSCSGQDSCQSGLADWQVQSIVAKHNELRAKHGACPLAYSKSIEYWTTSSPGFKASCAGPALQHNAPGTYGENIAMRSGDGLATFDAAYGAHMWYCSEENCFDYGNPKYSSQTGHFSQVVWKESLEIGCGLCQRKSLSSYQIVLMCNYAAPGNMANSFAANVPPVGSPDSCDVDECLATPCADGQTCSDASASTRNDFTCTCANGVAKTGRSAQCDLSGECTAEPCGDADAECKDPDENVSGDYTCTCTKGTGNSVGSTVTCVSDECLTSPCGTGQVCADPNTSPAATSDYTCTCNSSTTSATGRPASCDLTQDGSGDGGGGSILWVIIIIVVVTVLCLISCVALWWWKTRKGKEASAESVKLDEETSEPKALEMGDSQLVVMDSQHLVVSPPAIPTASGFTTINEVEALGAVRRHPSSPQLGSRRAMSPSSFASMEDSDSPRSQPPSLGSFSPPRRKVMRV